MSGATLAAMADTSDGPPAPSLLPEPLLPDPLLPDPVPPSLPKGNGKLPELPLPELPPEVPPNGKVPPELPLFPEPPVAGVVGPTATGWPEDETTRLTPA